MFIVIVSHLKLFNFFYILLEDNFRFLNLIIINFVILISCWKTFVALVLYCYVCVYIMVNVYISL